MQTLTAPAPTTTTKACQACRGTGRVMILKHRAPNRRHNVNRQDYKRYACPACLGSGKPIK